MRMHATNACIFFLCADGCASPFSPSSKSQWTLQEVRERVWQLEEADRQGEVEREREREREREILSGCFTGTVNHCASLCRKVSTLSTL